jgi:hypothetical protein
MLSLLKIIGMIVTGLALANTALGSLAILWMIAREPHADRVIVTPADAANACHAEAVAASRVPTTD